MPRSHLDVHDGSWFWPDDEGSEFSDLEAAEHETTVTAISIGRKLLRNDNERTVTVDVHDDQGQRVTDVTMTVTDETVIMKGRPSDGSARSMRDPVTSRKEIAEPLYPIRSPDGNLLLPVASNYWVEPARATIRCERGSTQSQEDPMEQPFSTSLTRRSAVVGFALTAAPVALAGAHNAYAQAKQTGPEKSLYERLGGVFAIAAVVDHFSDAVVKNPIVGRKSKNPKLREWHTKNLDRLPGLKFMRTLWVCNVSGGPFQFTATKPGTTPLGLEEAHRGLRISPAEFDEVAAELGRTLDFFKVPKREKAEVLAAFAAHKDEVTAGSVRTKRG